MRLAHIEIHNFRCFTDFSLQIDGESLTVVAPNAGGKSTLMTAIAWATTGARGLTIEDLTDPTRQLLIIATVNGLRSEDHGAFVEGALRFTGSPSVRIGIRASWDEYSERLDVDWGFPDAGWRRAGRDVRAALPVMLLPTTRDPSKLTEFAGSASVLATLVDELNAAGAAATAASAIASAGQTLTASPGVTSLLNDLHVALAGMIPDAGKYEVDPGERSVAELLRFLNLQLAHQGPPIAIRRQSSGLAQLTVAAVAVRLLEKRPETLVLIDEPELSLHPHAQRAAISALISTGAQVMTATHSASVLAEVDVRTIVALRRVAGTTVAARPGSIDAVEAKRLGRFTTPLTTEAFFARRVVFVEGITDYQAVRVVGETLGRNFDAEGIAIVALDGAASLTTFLRIMGPSGLALTIGGICDADYEADWCQYLIAAGLQVTNRNELNTAGFYVSDLDLEDELVTALGTTAAQLVFANDGAAERFQRYTQQAPNQDKTLHEQIRGFAQTKKAFWTPRLAAAIGATNVPPSIQGALDHV